MAWSPSTPRISPARAATTAPVGLRRARLAAVVRGRVPPHGPGACGPAPPGGSAWRSPLPRPSCARRPRTPTGRSWCDRSMAAWRSCSSHADGRERVLRHVTPRRSRTSTLGTCSGRLHGSGVSQQGWLELRANGSGDDRTGLARWGLDGPRRSRRSRRGSRSSCRRTASRADDWGPDGRYALFCTDSARAAQLRAADCGTQPHQDAGAVRVLDPDAGVDSEIIVP